MKATIYDVAREAGVSIATVSNVMNGKGKVSKKRSELIVKVMEKLNYQPSAIASALVGKKTFTLGLLLPDISNPFFAELARAIEDEAHDSGYCVMICSTDNKDERVERYLSLLEQKRVDGIMIGTGVENTILLSRLQAESIPIVQIARENALPSVNTVVTDDEMGGRLAARHLAELGHRRIAILSENLRVSSSRERIQGCRRELEERDIPLEDRNIVICEFSVEEGRRGARELLNRSDKPTALFCCNDLLAIGAMQVAKQLGIQVPEQLSIVGFDDTLLATVSDPPLTTVAQPIEQMGKHAVSLLVDDLINGVSDNSRIVLCPELRVRRSTGPV